MFLSLFQNLFARTPGLKHRMSFLSHFLTHYYLWTSKSIELCTENYERWVWGPRRFFSINDRNDWEAILYNLQVLLSNMSTGKINRFPVTHSSFRTWNLKHNHLLWSAKNRYSWLIHTNASSYAASIQTIMITKDEFKNLLYRHSSGS